MVLFQWQYHRLCPAMAFRLLLSSVNFGASGLSDAEQLVSPDCHFSHLKGVAVFCKSAFPLCSNAFMVMSPHVLAIFTDPFQLSLCPETAFAQSTGSPYPLPVPLAGSLYGHLICVWAWDAVSRGCVHVRVIHILPWQLWVQGGLTPVLFELPATVPSSRSMVALIGLEGWLTGSCPCNVQSWSQYPVSTLGVSSSPCAELCSLLVLTSWELTWVLLLWWWSSKLLGEQSHFFCVEMARNSANGCPTGGVPTKGDIW